MTKTFRDLGVDPALCEALADNDITHPFPIQELTLPLALDGHDLIGQARTGTGKTLAFGLPLLQRLDPSTKATQALVIVPTRELCLQVHADLQIGESLGLTTATVYGGVGYDEQIEALTGGVHVVVGTPGRLLDQLNRGNLDLSNVVQLVLDEADEMLDMGFLPDVERLIEACGTEGRHTMLFSATMPTPIVKLARRYMNHPTFTRADHEPLQTVPEVTQFFLQVHRMDKPRLLARILQSRDRGGVFVFVRTKHMADRLVRELEDLNTPAIAVHGDLRQETRERNLNRFRSGDATVLVCTEVAARGLDVTGVSHVVNYDCPDDDKMYLHRIGRTARAGAAGAAITFAEFNEVDRLNVIRKAVGAGDNPVEQVFSTSPQLDEWFDLPPERPWDHLSESSRSTAGTKRKGQSDGRPKSGRSREGRGGGHDADRRSRDESRSGKGQRDQDRSSKGQRDQDRSSKGQREAAGAPGSSGRDTDQREGSKHAGGKGADEHGDTQRGSDATASKSQRSRDASRQRSDRSHDATDRSRTRTRTRARTERSGGDPNPQRGETADSPGTTGGANDTSGAKDTGGDRSRQRARGGRDRGGRDRGDSRNGGDATGGDSGSDSAARGKGRADTADQSGDDRNDRQDHSQQQRQGGSDDAGKDRGGHQRSDRSRGSRGGRGRGDQSRSSGQGRGGGQSRGGGQGRNANQDRGDSGGSSGPKTPVRERGEDARGGGQPQLARRVKVEHLP